MSSPWKLVCFSYHIRSVALEMDPVILFFVCLAPPIGQNVLVQHSNTKPTKVKIWVSSFDSEQNLLR